MQKLKEDHAFLQELMCNTLQEVSAKGTFTQLTVRVEQCHKEKLNMEHVILR